MWKWGRQLTVIAATCVGWTTHSSGDSADSAGHFVVQGPTGETEI